MREDVLRTDLLVNAELLKGSLYLLGNTGKDHGHSPLAGTLAKITEVIDSC